MATPVKPAAAARGTERRSPGVSLASGPRDQRGQVHREVATSVPAVTLQRRRPGAAEVAKTAAILASGERQSNDGRRLGASLRQRLAHEWPRTGPDGARRTNINAEGVGFEPTNT